MRAMFAVGMLAMFVAACSGARSREDEPWEAEDPNDSTEAFDQRLRQKRLDQAESMEQARAVAARLAAKRGKRLEEVTGEHTPGAAARPLDRQPCPPDAAVKYTCRCAGGAKPGWAGKLGQAWKMQDGYWYAVGQVPAGKDRRMASDRAYGRALVKIAAVLKDQPDFAGAPDERIQAFLKGAESRAVHQEPGGELLALARYKPGGAVPPAVIEAKCPEAAKAPYACDCPAGQSPAWLDLQAWRGEDGWAYASGTSPGTSPEPGLRARNRAMSNLTRFLSGLTIQAGPGPGGGEAIRSWSMGDIDAKRVQLVAEQTHGPGTAVLLRYWIGE